MSEPEPQWAAVAATALLLAKLDWADDNRALPTVHRLPWADASARAREPYLDKARTRATALYAAGLLNPEWKPRPIELVME